MERDPGRLVLDEQPAASPPRTAATRSRDVVEPDRHARAAAAVPSASCSSSPCEPEKAMPGERQMPLEIGERAAADDREPAVEPPPQPVEQRRQRRRAPRIASGRLGQLDQRAVEIEEQGGAVEQRAGGGGNRLGHGVPVGKLRGAKLKPRFQSATAVARMPPKWCFTSATIVYSLSLRERRSRRRPTPTRPPGGRSHGTSAVTKLSRRKMSSSAAAPSPPSARDRRLAARRADRPGRAAS